MYILTSIAHCNINYCIILSTLLIKHLTSLFSVDRFIIWMSHNNNNDNNNKKCQGY